MDLRQLDYFVHVADLGSFSKAASLLSIAQSALSTRVRKLEVELKQPLLHRNGRGVTPTDAGKRLLQHARGILMQVDRTREELAEFRSTPSGHVVIGLPPTMARLLTVPVLKDFRGHFAEASIGIMEGLSASIVEWLTTGRIDIGLVFNPAPSPAVEIVDRKSTRLNSSHLVISYAVFCLKKKKTQIQYSLRPQPYRAQPMKTSGTRS